MSSRRKLKKELNYVCGELFADCVVLKMCDTCDAQVLTETMMEVIALKTEYISRISHTQRGCVKQFYAKLRAEFYEKADALSQKIVSL